MKKKNETEIISMLEKAIVALLNTPAMNLDEMDPIELKAIRQANKALSISQGRG